MRLQKGVDFCTTKLSRHSTKGGVKVNVNKKIIAKPTPVKNTKSFDKFIEKCTIAEYLLRTPSVFISLASVLIVIFTAIMNAAFYCKQAIYLRNWGFDPDIVDISSSNLLGSAAVAVLCCFALVPGLLLLAFSFYEFSNRLNDLCILRWELQRCAKNGATANRENLKKAKRKIYDACIALFNSKGVEITLLLVFIFAASLVLSLFIRNDIRAWRALLLLTAIICAFAWIAVIIRLISAYRKTRKDKGIAWDVTEESQYAFIYQELEAGSLPRKRLPEWDGKIKNKVFLYIPVAALYCGILIFMTTFFFVGRPESANEVKIVTLEESSYVLVYNNSDEAFLTRVEIEDGQLTVLVNSHRVIGLSDVTYEVIPFEKVVIEHGSVFELSSW